MCSIIPKKILKNIAENDKDSIRKSFYKDIIVDSKETEYREKRKRISQDIRKGVAPTLDTSHTEHLTVYDNSNKWDYVKEKVWEDFKETKHIVKKPKRTFTRDLDKVYDMFHDVLQRESFDGKNARLEVFLKFGKDYVNAYWDGEYLVFGTGDNYYFNDFSKIYDVIAHEQGHAITQYESNLEYENQSGALNEHISDVFGICAYHKKYNLSVTESNWIIGNGLFTKRVNAKGLRSFKDEVAYDDKVVGKDTQPKFMKDFVVAPNTDDGDYGAVHDNSGIPNHVFYLYNMKVGGYTWKNGTLEIWYNTMLKKNLGPNATFKEFANKTMDIAEQLDYSGALLENVWKEVGVL